MATLSTSSLKLPPIPVPRGRSPGSSPDVRRRSKEREQQRKRGAISGFRLPRLFRDRSVSTTAAYLTYSLTNLSEITAAESSDDGGIEPGPSSSQGSRKMSKTPDTGKWPVVKTWSSASAKHHVQQHLYQNSTSSTPSGRRSPKGSSPRISLVAPDAPKPRSQSQSHKFPFFSLTFRTGSGGSHRRPAFENVLDDKGNWVGFVQRKPTAEGQPASAWSNKTTFFTRARSADDILQLFVDDLLESEDCDC